MRLTAIEEQGEQIEDFRSLAAHRAFDLGGVFVLSPRQSEIDDLADRIAQTLVERGETLESMQQALREERERYAGQS